MANQNLSDPKDKTQQGDNRKAGDVDGNRGAKPKSGSQGVNESAGNQPDVNTGVGKSKTPDADNAPRHSEADALYRDQSGKK